MLAEIYRRGNDSWGCKRISIDHMKNLKSDGGYFRKKGLCATI